jgi:hypothetical protein
MILLPQPPRYWDYRYVPSMLGYMIVLISPEDSRLKAAI